MKARGQPLPQSRLRRGEIDAGHTDLGESELSRPLPQIAHELLTVHPMPRVSPPVPQVHAPILAIRTLHWPDEAACAASAAELAARPVLREAFVELQGPLGAGKTTFARHVLRALGVKGRIKSPTYALVETYELPAPEGGTASHFDFYRFDDAREWEDAGLRDLFAAPGLKLAEWPEKARAVLPNADLRITIEPCAGGPGDAVPESRREVRLQALTPRGKELRG